LIKYLKNIAEKYRFDPWIALWLSLIVGMWLQPSDIIPVYLWIPSGIPFGIAGAFICGYLDKNKNYLWAIRIVSFILIFPSEHFREQRIIEKYCIERLTTGDCIEVSEEGAKRLYKKPSKWEY